MKVRFPQWEHKFIVFSSIHLEGIDGLATAVYHNGVHIMDLDDETGYEASFALGQSHIDYLDTIAEEGWRLVSHTVVATSVVLETVAYPEFRHFFAFRRKLPHEKILDESDEIGGWTLGRTGVSAP